MSKVLSSLMAVLLVSAVALGDISQTQNYLAGLNNGVDLTQCETTAGTLNNLMIDNKQCAVGGCATEAQQFQVGVFKQDADAGGLCAVIGVLQTVESPASQVQLITNGVGPVGQQENLSLEIGQAATKSAGAGSGVATQLAALAQGQTGANAAMLGHQSSSVVIGQKTGVEGSPTAQGMAGATLTATTNQIQLVN
jgi:hypothetical protein